MTRVTGLQPLMQQRSSQQTNALANKTEADDEMQDMSNMNICLVMQGNLAGQHQWARRQ